MALVNQTTPLFTEIDIKVPFAGTDGLSPDEKQIIQWDISKYALQSATLHLTASQNYDSGADLTPYLNGQEVIQGKLSWQGLDTKEYTSNSDITNLIQNGTNDLLLRYHTAYGTAGSDCIASANITLAFLPLVTNPGTEPPASYSSTTNASGWLNFVQGLKTYTKTIVAIVIIGGIVYVIYKFKGIAYGKSLFNRISR